MGITKYLLTLGLISIVSASENIPGIKPIISNNPIASESIIDQAVINLEYQLMKPVESKRTLSIVSTDNKIMSYTFDCDRNVKHATEVLDILKERDIQTTIFLTGRFVKLYPDLVKRIVAEGHEVGNHSYNHPDMSNYSKEEFQEELIKTDKAFFELTGQNMDGYWRAPFGTFQKEHESWAAEIGFRHIYWTAGGGFKSLDTHDWVKDTTSTIYKTNSEIADRIINNPNKEGGIILGHLGSSRKESEVYEELPRIFDTLMTEGYQFTNITTLLDTN